MNGIGMMMKSMGLDPEAISSNIESMAQFVAAMKIQMDRVEAKLDAVLSGEQIEAINAQHALPAPTKDN